ncbi:hypothetical protein [Fibrella arboris]|uniref:hypothetical protein n=1 Tax=Fibrella arboris TaxID=3242486 RepID=UPI0035211B9C
MKQSFIFFAILLLFSGLQGCKKADAEPDWASAVVGKYTGKQTENGGISYASSLTITKTSAKGIAITLIDLRDNSEDAQINDITMTSATAFNVLYDPYRDGKGFNIDGTLSGNTLAVTVKSSGQLLTSFSGSK